MTAPSAVFGVTRLASPLSSPTYIHQLIHSNLDDSTNSLHRDSTGSLKEPPDPDDYHGGEKQHPGGDSKTGIDEEENKRIEINLNLLLYKVFYFLFYGAVGSLLPYLAVFYKQLYLSAQQVGFLIGIRPFIQMSTGPLWGALADTYNVKKGILLLSLCSWLITNYSVSFVRVPPETACSANLTLLKLPEVGRIRGAGTEVREDEGLKMGGGGMGGHGGQPSKHTMLLRSKKPYMKNTIQNYFWSPTFSKKKGKRRKQRHRRKAGNDSSLFVLLFAEIPRKHVNETKKEISVEEYEKTVTDFIDKTRRLRIRRSLLSGDEGKRISLKARNVTKTTIGRNVSGKHGGALKNEVPIERLLAAEQLEEEFDSLNTDEEYPWPLGMPIYLLVVLFFG